MSHRLENAQCEPACIACRMQKSCLKAPAPDVWDGPNDNPDRRMRIEWIDRLVGKKLVCGHLVEIPPVLLGFGMVNDIKCFRCGDWRKLAPEPKPRKKAEANGQANLDPAPY